MIDKEKLIKKVLDCAMAVRKALLPGYLEKVYENALMIELSKNGISAEQQVRLEVFYDGKKVGDYTADILVEKCLILEIKATQHIDKSHEAQLVNYLRTTNIEDGILINFGSSDKLEIKRKFRDYIKTN